jgi:broad specificity phosphatase PhoE
LVRHGQSEWNSQGLWQGQADPPLSEAGKQEAELAASRLQSFSGRVFASPLLRAKQTAEIVAAQIGLEMVKIEPDLREIDVGDFSGLTNDEITERFPEAWEALVAGRLDAFPSGESRENLRLRVLRAVEGLASRHPDEELLVVTHGGTIASLERHLGVHPGEGVRNLVGRWFVVKDGELTADGGRVSLLDD